MSIDLCMRQITNSSDLRKRQSSEKAKRKADRKNFSDWKWTFRKRAKCYEGGDGKDGFHCFLFTEIPSEIK